MLLPSAGMFPYFGAFVLWGNFIKSTWSLKRTRAILFYFFNFYCFVRILSPPFPPLNWGWKSARRERKVGIRSQFYDTPKSFFAVFVPDWSTKICRKHSGFCWIMYSTHSRTGHIHTLEFNIAAPGRKRHVRILPFLFIVIPVSFSLQ